MASPLEETEEKLSDATDGEITQFKGCLARAGFGRKLVCEVGTSQKNELAEVMYEAVRQHLDKNPYEISIEDTLAVLRRANVEERWDIAEEAYLHLYLTAPPWPKGRHAYRSLRIRFGEGDEGVAKTFEAHVARIKTVFEEKGFWRWEHLHSGSVPYEGKPVERLRLLAGNHTHKPILEWVIVDLDANRERESVTEVRGPHSLADELLVIAWLFPDMIRAIDYVKFPGLFAAGYEVNVPGCNDGEWRSVVVVYFNRGGRRVDVFAADRGTDNSDYSVPVLQGLRSGHAVLAT